MNRIPNIRSLKLLVGFFLVYMIHIHTAYTSDLINILTVPRYEGLIKNVEEVADSELPIIMDHVFATFSFENVIDGGSLLRKINKLIIPYFDKNCFELIKINMTKRFIVVDEDIAWYGNSESRVSNRFLGKRKESVFLTNDISGEIKEVFVLKNGGHFAESLNAVITHLWKSGTQEADANLNPSRLNLKMREPPSVMGTYFLEDESAQPLRWKDLLPMFVVLLICYSFCIIVLVAEIFLHKIIVQ